MTFDTLVDSYYEPVYRHVRRIVVSHDDACDVCQDTFLRALRSFDSLRDTALARAWIYRIATNEALRFLASRKSSGELLSDRLAETLADETADTEPDPRLLRFNRALLSLTPAQRGVRPAALRRTLLYRHRSDCWRFTRHHPCGLPPGQRKNQKVYSLLKINNKNR